MESYLSVSLSPDFFFQIEEPIALVRDALGAAVKENADAGRPSGPRVAQRVFPEDQTLVGAFDRDARAGTMVFDRGAVVQNRVLLQHVAMVPLVLGIEEEYAVATVVHDRVLAKEVVGVAAPKEDPGPAVVSELVLLEKHVVHVHADEHP